MDGFTKEIRVRWDQTDCTTRIYFTMYMKWMDDVLTDFFRSKGITFDAVGKLHLNGERVVHSFAIGEYSCRIKKPSKFDDLIRITVRVKEVREKVLTFEGEFVDVESGNIVSNAWISFVSVNDEGDSAPIPDEVKALL